MTFAITVLIENEENISQLDIGFDILFLSFCYLFQGLFHFFSIVNTIIFENTSVFRNNSLKGNSQKHRAISVQTELTQHVNK